MAKIEKTIIIKADTSDVNKKLKGLDKQVEKTTTTAKNSGKGLSGAFSGMGAAIKATIPSLAALKTALISTGIGAIVVAVGAFVSVLKKANDLGAEFSKGLSTLRAVTGNTADELLVLNNQAKQLGSTTQFTAIEVVGLQTELAKLGFTIKDIKNSTPAILDLAASLEIDLASAAEFAGSVVRSFGLTTEDTQKVVDVMAKSTSSSALNFDALRESLKVVAPVARATGVSIEQTAAYLGVLANNGLKGSVAGTGLSKSFIELNKKGIDINDAFKMVTDSSNGLGTAIELVGVVGAKSFLSLAEGTEDIEELKVAFENAEGAAKSMAEIRLDNLEGDTTKLSSAWDGLLLNIEDGDGILNKISRGGVKNLTKTVGILTNAVELAGFALDYYFGNSKSLGEQESGLSKRAASLGFFVGSMKIIFAKFKLFLSDIPIIGKSIDSGKAKASLDEAVRMVSFANKKLKQISAIDEKGAKKGAFWQEWKKSRIVKSEKELAKSLEAVENDKKDKRKQETEDEKAAREKSEKESAAALEKSEKELANIINKTKKSAEDLEDESELEKAQRKRERALKELEDVKLDVTKKAEAKIAINKYYNDLEIVARQKDTDARKVIQDKIDKENSVKRVEELELQKDFEELSFQEQRDLLKEREAALLLDKVFFKSLTNEQLLELEKSYSDASVDIAKKESDAKQQALNSYAGALSSISGVIGQETQAGKAIAIASSLVNTYAAISGQLKAFSGIPVPGYAIAQAIATGVVGFANVKKIASVKIPNSKGGGGGAGAGSLPSAGAASQPPSFNIVGASESSQLADAIGGQSQQPIQTYVVANDVTTAQSLQNNIVEGATIG
ncbi:MAG: phage tail tape measure protein [Lacinutrix sp.]|uniref:phage tail tape measure protein n=1 Tax=Lacinutrix sp. TaxID=1937692 RepID=UPI0030AE324E